MEMREKKINNKIIKIKIDICIIILQSWMKFWTKKMTMYVKLFLYYIST